MNADAKSDSAGPVLYGSGEPPGKDVFKANLLQNLLHPKTVNDFRQAEMVVSFTWPYETGLKDVLVDAMRQNPGVEALEKIYPIFANRFGLDVLRKSLRSYAQKHQDFDPILKESERLLGFDSHKPASDLREIYREIVDEFKKYPPNEKLLHFEAQLLQQTFQPGMKLLDVGCGPKPRHMEQLAGSGFQLIGIDLVEENVQAALKENPDLDIRIADWHNLPFPDQSFDGLYCLGRSLLHNTTIEDWLQTLDEMRRVLHPNPLDQYETMDLPPSKVILDIPMTGTGPLGDEQRRFRENARRLGIYQLEGGDIHDSPDGEHFFDRFIPTIHQFTQMAHMCGFEAHIVARKPYGNESNQSQNMNVYWELTVSGRPLSKQQRQFEMGQLTTKPIVDIDVTEYMNQTGLRRKTTPQE